MQFAPGHPSYRNLNPYWNDGQAQPQRPQSQGTQYNPNQGQPFAAPGSIPQGAGGWDPRQPFASPGQAQPKQSPWANSTPYNPNQGQPFGAWGQQQQAPQQQPPPFQAQTFNFDGTQSQMPNFQQRDAFISQINNQLGQMQGQSWNQPMGAPQFNFGQMWGQAGNMVQQGWQNPFAQQQTGQQPSRMAGSEQQAEIAREYARYGVDINSPAFTAFADQYFNDPSSRPRPDAYSPQEVAAAFRQSQSGRQQQQNQQQQDSAAAIRNLLQGFNIPDNVMSQLTSLLGGQQPSPQPPPGTSPPTPQQPGLAGPGQAQPIQDPNATSTPYSPPTLASLQQSAADSRLQQQKQAFFARSGLNAQASADEMLVASLSDPSFGLPPEMLPPAMRELNAGLGRIRTEIERNRPTNREPAYTQALTNGLNDAEKTLQERAQYARQLRDQYGMDATQVSEWLDNNLPLPSAGQIQGQAQAAQAAERQQRSVTLAAARKTAAVLALESAKPADKPAAQAALNRAMRAYEAARSAPPPRA